MPSAILSEAECKKHEELFSHIAKGADSIKMRLYADYLDSKRDAGMPITTEEFRICSLLAAYEFHPKKIYMADFIYIIETTKSNEGNDAVIMSTMYKMMSPSGEPLSYEEMAKFVKVITENSVPEEIIIASFKQYDIDKDGHLNLEEFSAAITVAFADHDNWGSAFVQPT